MGPQYYIVGSIEFYSKLRGFLSPRVPPFHCLGTSEVLSSLGSYLVITTFQCTLRHSDSSYSFLGFLPLDLNRRSRIVLNSGDKNLLHEAAL